MVRSAPENMEASTMIAITPFQKNVKFFFNTIYRPMLARIVGGIVTPNTRFPDRKAADAEAWECARLHAGLVMKLWSISNTPPDPWESWRGNPNTKNPDDRKKARVKTYVVTDKGEVYDHRTRYFIPQPFADKLGFSNPTWAERLSPDW